MRQILFCFFLIAFHLSPTDAQTPTKEWEKHYGSPWNDAAHALIQNMEGNLVFVGETKSRYKKGKEVYFVITDQSGKELFGKEYGRVNDESANAIIQTPDGGYVIAGYSSSKAKGYQGNKDAWLLKIDAAGEVMWDTLLGSKEEDIFYDLIQDDTGNLYAAGKRNNEFWIISIDQKGVPRWEIAAPQKTASEARALVYHEGEIYATGFSKGKRTETLLLLNIKEGEIKWQKEWPDKRGMDIKLGSDENLIIGGSSLSRGEDMLLLNTSLDGTEQSVYTYGAKGDDGAYTVYRDWRKIQYLLGFSFSHIKAARREKLWVTAIDSIGNEIWDEKQYFGGDFSDKGYDMIQTNNGDLILAGVTHSNSIKDTDAWLIKLKGPSIPTSNTPPTLKVNPTGFSEPNKILGPNDQIYYEAEIQNTGKIDAYNVIATIDTPVDIGIRYLEKIHIGYIAAGSTKNVYFPITSKESIKSGEHTFRYTFSEANNASLSPISFNIQMEQEATPQLILSGGEFNLADNVSEVVTEQPIKLDITVTNTGKAKAENVRIKFSFPYKVEALTDKLLDIGSLAPETSKQVSFNFQAQDSYLGEDIVIDCRVMESLTKFGQEKSYSIPFNQALRNTIPTVNVPEQQFLLLNWSTPNPALYGTTSLVWEESVIPITLIANSTDTILQDQFKVFINGVDRSTMGAKMDKVKMVAAKDQDASGKQIYTHTFVSDVKLNQGDNQIHVEITNAVGNVKSEILHVNHAPLKPNLYLVSVGVPHIDLQFTKKDAEDFSNAFLGQENNLFNKIIVHKLLNKPANTTARAISYAISEIERAEQEDQLLEKDVLILFFSTHGMTDSKNNNYLLFPSDVDRLDVRGTAIEFGHDIVDRLQSIKCKKFFFVDACRSEAYNEDKKNMNFASLEEAIFSLASEQAGVKTMLSCSQGESSYEDKSWNNGAFTKVLVEGLQNKSFKGEKGEIKSDVNMDQVITFQELYNYVHLRVPQLVQKTKGAEHKQHPTLPENHQGVELPIFFINK